MWGLVSALPLGANQPPLGQAGSPSLSFLNRQRGCWDLSPQDQHDAQLQACGRWHSDGGWYFPVWEMYVRKQCFMNMLMFSPRSRSRCAELAPGIKDG